MGKNSFEINIENLANAISNKEYNKVRLILEREFNLNSSEWEINSFESILCRAVANNNFLVTKLLIEDLSIGPYIIEADTGRNLLHIAIVNKSNNVIRFIIDYYKIDINSRDFSGNAPINYISDELDYQVISSILNHPYIDLNIISSSSGNNILHYAVISGKVELVRSLLIKDGLNVNIYNMQGKTPLHLAILYNQHEIAKLLMGHKLININLREKNCLKAPIHYAVQKNNLEILAALLESSQISVNIGEKKFNLTALHLAVIYNFQEMVKLIVSHKDAKVNSKDKYKNTPLDYAIFREYTQICEILFDYYIRSKLPTDGVFDDFCNNIGNELIIYNAKHVNLIEFDNFDSENLNISNENTSNFA